MAEVMCAWCCKPVEPDEPYAHREAIPGSIDAIWHPTCFVAHLEYVDIQHGIRRQ